MPAASSLLSEAPMHLSSLAVPGSLVRARKRMNKLGWAADSLLFRHAVGDGAEAALLQRLYGRKAELVRGFLEEQGLQPQRLGARKRMLYLDCGGRFYKLAFDPKRREQLRLEYRNWCDLREAPRTGDVVAEWLELCERDEMTILASQRLSPLAPAEMPAAAGRVTAALAAAGEPVRVPDVPELQRAIEVVAGLNGGRLPKGFACELALQRALQEPLRVGPMHQDLHRANLMVDEAGGYRVIDLKSMRLETVQSLGILTGVIKEQVLREGGNLIDAAHTAQRRDWQLCDYEPMLRDVDLPRPLWGQLSVLWLLGQRLAKRGTATGGRRWAQRLLISPVFRRRWGYCALILGGGLAVGAGMA